MGKGVPEDPQVEALQWLPLKSNRTSRNCPSFIQQLLQEGRELTTEPSLVIHFVPLPLSGTDLTQQTVNAVHAVPQTCVSCARLWK